MPESELPRYCVKCGRNYFARYDVIDAQILVWCPAKTCREMQHTIPIYGFHARPASQQRQVAEMVERTERETNESQGSEFLQVHLRLAEQNDTIIPCLAEKIASGSIQIAKPSREWLEQLESYQYVPAGGTLHTVTFNPPLGMLAQRPLVRRLSSR